MRAHELPVSRECGSSLWRGANHSTLVHCLLLSNTANWYGGGARNSTLTGCILTGNLGVSGGGGADSSTLTDCQLLGNSSPGAGNLTKDPPFHRPREWELQAARRLALD